MSGTRRDARRAPEPRDAQAGDLRGWRRGLSRTQKGGLHSRPPQRRDAEERVGLRRARAEAAA